MGAAFFCQIAALDTSQTLQNSASYIGSWLKALKDNPKWVLKASKQAREAVELVMTGKLTEANTLIVSVKTRQRIKALGFEGRQFK
jgi:antirestriction protein ArdC